MDDKQTIIVEVPNEEHMDEPRVQKIGGEIKMELKESIGWHPSFKILSDTSILKFFTLIDSLLKVLRKKLTRSIVC